MSPSQTDLDSFGADLRAVRRSRGLTLQDLASALGKSVGWLSQVERDISNLSNSDLDQIAKVLKVPASTLSAPQNRNIAERGVVVRAGDRRPVRPRVPGLVEQLLSPDLTDDFEMVHCSFAPFSKLREPVLRQTQELGFVISGGLDLVIAGQRYSVGVGDSFRIRAEPFTWHNPNAQEARLVWVISPPVY